MIQLRKPTVADVPQIVELLRPHVLAERLLPRSPRQVAERLRDFLLAEQEVDGRAELVGVASISLVDTYLAEIGAIAAVQPEIEALLVRQLLAEATEMGVADAFVLTDAPELFEGLGFRRTRVQEIPEKRDRQCLRCSRLPRCRQVALTIPLGEALAQAAK
jgi:amino-acid N-acetyltransferase